MTVAYVDTDVLIRIVTGDDPAKQEAGFVLFDQVESGELTLMAPDTVIADAVFVLSSKRLYAMPREEVYERLSTLLRYPHFEVENGRVVQDALEVFASSNVDFGDAMVAASVRHSDTSDVYSYDRDLDKFPWVVRKEP